jgi:exosome complex component CSL4
MTDFVMPGDKLGFIEEIEGGANTFDDGDTVRA